MPVLGGCEAGWYLTWKWFTRAPESAEGKTSSSGSYKKLVSGRRLYNISKVWFIPPVLKSFFLSLQPKSPGGIFPELCRFILQILLVKANFLLSNQSASQCLCIGTSKRSSFEPNQIVQKASCKGFLLEVGKMDEQDPRPEIIMIHLIFHLIYFPANYRR